MRVAEFQITHYGPLKPTGQIKLKDFDLFYGKNEYGKTLLIDSIVKILLGKNSQDFSAIDRIDQFPEGYGMIIDEDGKQWKLPEKGDLTQLSKLTSTEFRNIFIIRNSDLTIPAGEEFEFYKNITGRLTGLRTPLVRSIKMSLQKIGNLTKPNSTATLSGSANFHKLKIRVKQAQELIEKIDELLVEAQKGDFDKLEEQITKLKENEKITALKMEELLAAQKREKYGEGMRAMETLTQAEEQLEQLEVFNDDDLQSWKEAERDLKKYEKQHEKLLEKLSETKKEFEQRNASFEEKHREFEITEGRKKIIDEEIKPRLRNYETTSRGLASLKSKEKFVLASSSAFLILLAISLIGLAISQLPLFTLSSVLFLVLALLCVALKLLSVQKRGSIATLWQEIRLVASKFELEANDIESILAKIQNFDDNYLKSHGAIKKLETDIGVLKHEISRLTDEEVPRIEKEIKVAEDTINSLKLKSKAETLQNYTKTLKTKQQQEKMKDRFTGILKSHFGEKSKKASVEENIAYWKEKIAELEPYKDKSQEIQYNEKRISELKEKEQIIKQQREELQQELTEFHGKLEDISKEVNASVRPSESTLICETMVDMGEISKILRKFIDDTNGNASTVLEAMKIFEEIEGEEEQKVEQLFSKDSRVSSYFKEITGGLYQKVEYLSDEQKIQITIKTGGGPLGADKLSGGAYDQLYLCIRLALGEKILKGAKGFFIMDDPFVKADRDRLAKQLKVLKRISEEGWQILYFTAKDEVKNALKEDLVSKQIGYHEIESLFS